MKTITARRAGALACLALAGCMTVSDKQTIVQNPNGRPTFANKTVAVLPVKTQTSLAPDSVMALRTEVNKRLGQAVRNKLTASTVSDMTTVADQLNKTNSLPVFEQLLTTYENTGVIDKRQTAALGKALNSEYLLLPRLKAEKMDIAFISKGMGASLDLMIVNAHTAEVVWGGSGDWKRGGIFGFGGASADEAAGRLVELAVASL